MQNFNLTYFVESCKFAIKNSMSYYANSDLKTGRSLKRNGILIFRRILTSGIAQSGTLKPGTFKFANDPTVIEACIEICKSSSLDATFNFDKSTSHQKYVRLLISTARGLELIPSDTKLLDEGWRRSIVSRFRSLAHEALACGIDLSRLQDALNDAAVQPPPPSLETLFIFPVSSEKESTIADLALKLKTLRAKKSFAPGLCGRRTQAYSRLLSLTPQLMRGPLGDVVLEDPRPNLNSRSCWIFSNVASYWCTSLRPKLAASWRRTALTSVGVEASSWQTPFSDFLRDSDLKPVDYAWSQFDFRRLFHFFNKRGVFTDLTSKPFVGDFCDLLVNCRAVQLPYPSLPYVSTSARQPHGFAVISFLSWVAVKEGRPRSALTSLDFFAWVGEVLHGVVLSSLDAFEVAAWVDAFAESSSKSCAEIASASAVAHVVDYFSSVSRVTENNVTLASAVLDVNREYLMTLLTERGVRVSAPSLKTLEPRSPVKLRRPSSLRPQTTAERKFREAVSLKLSKPPASLSMKRKDL
jgi:hypothetical protein